MQGLEELKHIAASVGERRGWDFSKVRHGRAPVPWDYRAVVCRYLRTSSRVLDVGTGGGERFLGLASRFGVGVGIDADPTMIEVARENEPTALAKKVTFQVMRAEALQFPDAAFDIVLNRHSFVHVEEIVRVLRPGGFFITQLVGTRNTHNICTAFGCGPGGEYEIDRSQTLPAFVEAFERRDCRVICRAEYDVDYWFEDVVSLVFWLKAIPIPEDFDIEVHWQQVGQIIATCRTARGIETNEHRELLIVQKQQDSAR